MTILIIGTDFEDLTVRILLPYRNDIENRLEGTVSQAQVFNREQSDSRWFNGLRICGTKRYTTSAVKKREIFDTNKIVLFDNVKNDTVAVPQSSCFENKKNMNVEINKSRVFETGSRGICETKINIALGIRQCEIFEIEKNDILEIVTGFIFETTIKELLEISKSCIFEIDNNRIFNIDKGIFERS